MDEKDKKTYIASFQGEQGHELMTIRASNNKEARNKFNRNISIKEQDD